MQQILIINCFRPYDHWRQWKSNVQKRIEKCREWFIQLTAQCIFTPYCCCYSMFWKQYRFAETLPVWRTEEINGGISSCLIQFESETILAHSCRVIIKIVNYIILKEEINRRISPLNWNLWLLIVHQKNKDSWSSAVKLFARLQIAFQIDCSIKQIDACIAGWDKFIVAIAINSNWLWSTRFLFKITRVRHDMCISTIYYINYASVCFSCALCSIALISSFLLVTRRSYSKLKFMQFHWRNSRKEQKNFVRMFRCPLRPCCIGKIRNQREQRK